MLISGGHKLPFVYLLPDEHGATYSTKIVSGNEQFRTEYEKISEYLWIMATHKATPNVIPPEALHSLLRKVIKQL